MTAILSKSAIEVLSQKLNLPTSGKEQDWEIELANPARVEEFLNLYKLDHDLDEAQKLALMALILASCDEVLAANGILEVNQWEGIKRLLQSNPVYKGLISYWALPNETRTDYQFKLTPYIRSLS